MKQEEQKYTMGDYAWHRYYLKGVERTVASLAIHSKDKYPIEHSIGQFTQKLAYKHSPGIELRWKNLIKNVKS